MQPKCNMSSESTPSRGMSQHQGTKEKYRALLSTASQTAGSDNWKTAAGRLDGPDGFTWGDAWRLTRIHFRSTSIPSCCPVCMDKPNSADEWYITKSCRHAVCRDCLQNYAASLISDPNHSGPLRCPCCPRLLRVEDAKVALDKHHRTRESKSVSLKRVAPKAMSKRVLSKRRETGGLFDDPSEENVNSALQHLERWDEKMRNETLRSMGDFRPCPHCSKGTNESNATCDSDERKNAAGGGFVTGECLAPINEERERKAERLLIMAGNPVARAILLAYFIYYVRCSTQESNGGSAHAAFQVLSALLPSVILPLLVHAIRLVLVQMARKEMMQPIIVSCPCCLKPFNLEASSELQINASSDSATSEAATERWKNSNTRPCPRCSSPIMKDGGCNHMKCQRCRAEFCWACMRSRTSCKAYQCKNGAPYGNAFGDGSLRAVRAGLEALEREREAGQTLIERIDRAEASAMNNLRILRANPTGAQFSLRHAAVLFITVLCLSSPGRVANFAWNALSRVLALAASVFLPSLCIACAVMCFESGRQWMNNNIPNVGAINGFNHERRRGHQQIPHRGLNPRTNSVRRRMPSFARSTFRTEDEQLAEAIARSLVEQ